MGSKVKFRSVVYVLIALTLVLTTAQVLAGGNSSRVGEHELTGVVTAVTPTTITIGTMTFDITLAEVHDGPDGSGKQQSATEEKPSGFPEDQARIVRAVLR